ncbi:Molybdenum cofactor sulfurase [Sergentomyia squamirostris]
MAGLEGEYSGEEWERIHKEFRRIKNDHYLDHAGATLYSEKQLEACFEDLSGNLYSNPHTSKSTEDLIDQVRFRILKHFNTDSSSYSVIFTSGATAALKIVAESFEFSEKHSQFRYLADSHTSVLGMRELVKSDHVKAIEKGDLQAIVEKDHQNVYGKGNSRSLIVFPAQCNFNGYKYPLKIIDHFHCGRLPIDLVGSQWFVCLDAASFASTNFLNLSDHHPDFVCISFYKIFGYPTGLGALLVSKRGEDHLKKRYYGGGTVKIAMSRVNFHEKRDCLHERFEDGTISYLSIISLLQGFNTLDRLVPGNEEMRSIERISRHTFNLAKYLRNTLLSLKHPSGGRVIVIYEDSDYGSSRDQGGIVCFNILNNDGRFVGFAEFACLASIHNITIRTGCFCNPGACQRHLWLTDDDVREHYQAGHVCGDAYDLINGIPTGCIRASMGYMTTKDNVDALIHMIENCYCRSNSRTLPLASIPSIYRRFPTRTDPIKLEMMCIYPIKSCGAFKVYDKWPLSPRGFLYDREWMIVSDKGVALTQKNNTKMCLIRPRMDLERRRLILNHPEIKSIELDLEVNGLKIRKDSSLCQSKVCGDRIQGFDCGDKVAMWLEEALEVSGVRLIRQSSSEKRFFRKNGKTEDCSEISLSNQAQFLLINSSSVSWLMDKVTDWDDEPDRHSLLSNINDRFRGNLVIKSPKPLEEASWKLIRIGQVLFKVDGQCTRCQMICIDQETGEKTTEPLRTIAREFEGKMKFGIYLSQLGDFTESLVLSCNDTIEILN